MSSGFLPGFLPISCGHGAELHGWPRTPTQSPIVGFIHLIGRSSEHTFEIFDAVLCGPASGYGHLLDPFWAHELGGGGTHRSTREVGKKNTAGVQGQGQDDSYDFASSLLSTLGKVFLKGELAFLPLKSKLY